jgi:hypothetical protein
MYNRLFTCNKKPTTNELNSTQFTKMDYAYPLGLYKYNAVPAIFSGGRRGPVRFT